MSDDLKIFHEYTNLSYLKVTIDDFEIMPGDFITLQVDQSFKSSGLVGKLEFKDTYDILNNSIVNFDNTNIVKISFKDFSGDPSIRTYRITNISHRKYGERSRIITLNLLDEVTYTLANTNIDYYYAGDAVQGAVNLINQLCSSIISSNKLKVSSFSNTESQSSTFLANSSMSALDFITNKLSKFNIRLFQTRDTICIKELIPSQTAIQETDYTDKTMNNKYIYKVHDREQITVNNIFAPATETYRITGKDVNANTKNLSDVESEFAINSNAESTSNLQSSSRRLNTQATLSEGVQKMKLFDTYMNTNRLMIAVPGVIKTGFIDSVIKITLNGVVGFNDTSQEGDTSNSGKYFVCGVSDLFIGEKFIQRLTVSRMNNVKPRKLFS